MMRLPCRDRELLVIRIAVQLHDLFNVGWMTGNATADERCACPWRPCCIQIISKFRAWGGRVERLYRKYSIKQIIEIASNRDSTDDHVSGIGEQVRSFGCDGHNSRGVADRVNRHGNLAAVNDPAIHITI